MPARDITEEFVRFYGLESDMNRDYLKITAVSEGFNSWHAQSFNHRFDDTTKDMAWEARMWELQFQLAIAQQLSIVASHLGKIVREAEK